MKQLKTKTVGVSMPDGSIEYRSETVSDFMQYRGFWRPNGTPTSFLDKDGKEYKIV